MSKYSIPAEVEDALKKMGQRVKLARIRRRWSVADLAARAGVSRNTMMSLESGREGVSIGTWATVLWALGLDEHLAQVADPDADLHGKSLEMSRTPRRIRQKLASKDDYDF